MKIEPNNINAQITKTYMDINRLKKLTKKVNAHDTRKVNWIEQILTLQTKKILLKRLKQMLKFIK